MSDRSKLALLRAPINMLPVTSPNPVLSPSITDLFAPGLARVAVPGARWQRSPAFARIDPLPASGPPAKTAG